SSDDGAPVRPAVQGGGESGGAAQGGLPSFAASFLRNPSARGRHGHSADSGVAWTRKARHDGALHPRGDRTHRQDREPARALEPAAPPASEARRREAAGAIARRRSWFDRYWRSRTSSASTVPLGARPTAAMRASTS